MDRAVIEQKLESLRRCLARIRSKQPFTSEQLASDFDLQDIIALNLTRAVQLSVDMAVHMVAGLDMPAPSTMGESFDRLVQANVIDATLAQKLKSAVGSRNVAVHNYSNETGKPSPTSCCTICKTLMPLPKRSCRNRKLWIPRSSRGMTEKKPGNDRKKAGE